jgi:hypothetical protein
MKLVHFWAHLLTIPAVALTTILLMTAVAKSDVPIYARVVADLALIFVFVYWSVFFVVRAQKISR